MALFNSRNSTKREISLLYNTLGGVLKFIENRYTTVDLRNECCVTGKIVKVDGYMNIEMEDVILYDMRENQKSLSNFFVSARNIRDVHIPEDINPIAALKNQFTNSVRKPKKPVHTFKKARAMKKNKEILMEAYKIDAQPGGSRS